MRGSFSRWELILCRLSGAVNELGEPKTFEPYCATGVLVALSIHMCMPLKSKVTVAWPTDDMAEDVPTERRETQWR